MALKQGAIGEHPWGTHWFHLMWALIPLKVAHNILEGRQDFMISIERIEFFASAAAFAVLFFCTWPGN